MNIGLIELPSSFRRVLRFFRESRGTATQIVNVLRAEGGEANIGLVLQPKGTGAFSLQIPDGTTVGGNARGTNAIDLQTSRTAATQVASGSGAFVAGINCTSSGSQTIAIGVGCSASGTGASVALGNNCSVSNAGNNVAMGKNATSSSSSATSIAIGDGATASGSTAIALGQNCNATGGGGIAIGNASSATANDAAAIGKGNTANATESFAAGNANTASGSRSSIPGGGQATTNSIQGLLAYGFNGTSSGQNQMSFFGGRQSTTNTSARITADAAAAAATNQLTLRNNSAFRFEGRVISRDTVTNDAKEWSVTGLIKRGANAAATSLVGTPTVTSSFADTNASAWALTVSADTTNGSLALTIDTTGTTNAVRTTAVVWSQEVA